jgi:hypothetical protein
VGLAAAATEEVVVGTGVHLRWALLGLKEDLGVAVVATQGSLME